MDTAQSEEPSRYRAVLLLRTPIENASFDEAALHHAPGVFYFHFADVFRSLDLHSETGREFQNHAHAGNVVPDRLLVRMFKDHIDRAKRSGDFQPKAQSLILDGFPQNPALGEMLKDTIDFVAVRHVSTMRG